MNESEFLRQQQAAVERMREMNAKASSYNNVKHTMPPVPSFVNITENRRSAPPQPPENPVTDRQKPIKSPPNNAVRAQPNGLQIPFLDSIMKDADTTLIIGLLLILMSENSDKMLLFALIYILL